MEGETCDRAGYDGGSGGIGDGRQDGQAWRRSCPNEVRNGGA